MNVFVPCEMSYLCIYEWTTTPHAWPGTPISKLHGRICAEPTTTHATGSGDISCSREPVRSGPARCRLADRVFNDRCHRGANPSGDHQRMRTSSGAIRLAIRATRYSMSQPTEIVRSETIHPTSFGTFYAVWGVLGFILLLTRGLVRMVPIALETINHPLTGIQISAMAVFFVAFGAGKGYFLFQRVYAPKFAERARMLLHEPSHLNGFFAPLFCMGLFGAPRPKLLRSWVITTFVIVMIVLSRSLPFPWRGTVLGGVCLGLAWGVIAVAYRGWQVVFSKTGVAGGYAPVR